MIPTRAAAWVLVPTLLTPLTAGARMYQWVSPTTATPQLSGEPPPWYRSGREGPRVRVFENGNLVDDTAIALPDSQRQDLRAAAFREAEERRRDEAVRRLERAALLEERRRAELERRAQAEEQHRALAAAAAEGAAGKKAPAADRTVPEGTDRLSLDEESVARLKAIIADFDRQGGAPKERR